jgi:hypothetical protein
MTQKDIDEIVSHLTSLKQTKADEAKTRLEELIASVKNCGEEDERFATGLAVEAAKNFLQLAAAFVVVVAGFYQFGVGRAWEFWPPLALLIASALAGLVSMGAGFVVISTAYKSEAKPNGSKRWSITPLRGWLSTQAIAGVLALLILGAAIGFPKKELRTVTVTSPAGSTATSPADSLLFSGRLMPLTIEQKGRFTLRLLPSPKDSTQTVMMQFHH